MKRAAASGWIDPATASRSRAGDRPRGTVIRRLPSERANAVEVALSEVGALSGRLTRPRALALIGQLKANNDFFVRRGPPHDRTDIKDADGIVYRFFAGRCFEFHPLAEFGELNARVSAKDVEGTQRLADALAARGAHQLGGVAWEYYFAFGGGHAPWLSGMAQAVATQAFTRAANLVPDSAPEYLAAARGAYRVIPAKLVSYLSAGPWIRLYAFDPTAVLNAQLQTIYSLKTYASNADDPRADALASRMQASAVAMLPRFDTGYWTYYSLPATPSTLHYQKYVVRLLNLLTPGDSRFGDAAKRFAGYARQPPAFRLEQGPLGELRFWLSKPATVSAYSSAGPTQRYGMRDGWHSLRWAEPKRAGIFPIHVNAVDWAGNRSSFDALPIVRVGAGAVSGTVRAVAASPGDRQPLFIGAALDDPRSGVARAEARAEARPRRRRLADGHDDARARPRRGIATAHGKPGAARAPNGCHADRRLDEDGARTVRGGTRAARSRHALPDARARGHGRRRSGLRRRLRRGARRRRGRAAERGAGAAARRQFVAEDDAHRARSRASGRRRRRDGVPSCSRERRGLEGRQRSPGDVDAEGRLRRGAAAADRRARHADDDPGRPARVVSEGSAARPVRGVAEGSGRRLRAADHGDCLLDDDRGDRPRPARRRRRFRRACERHRLRERRAEGLRAARLGRRRPGTARDGDLPGSRVPLGGQHARVPDRARRVGRRVGRARLRTRLPVPDHARRRARPAGLGPARDADGRRSPDQARAAEGAAVRGRLPLRCADRRPRQPGTVSRATSEILSVSRP